MRRTIEVFLGESPRAVGVLHFDHQGARESGAFEYGAEWLAAGDRFPLEPGLPLVSGPQFHRRSPGGSVFHGAIADTEPDGWAKRVILRDHAKRRKSGGAARPASALDFLLSVDDVSRVGALRFRDEEGTFRRASLPGRRAVPPLIELSRLFGASRAVETQTETEADLEYLRGRGTSLGGLRPKCSIIDAVGRLAIGKFPSVTDERAVTKGEVLALRLAHRAGIDAAEAELVDSDGAPIAVIRRFDRLQAGGRLLYVSAATMLGATAEEEHTYTEIADALRQHGASAAADLEELWRRIAFSILINNVDDHLRNHGFLHVADGQWRLAPAFDLNPFPERARELKTWISEDVGPEASIEGLRSVSAYFGIKRARGAQILREVDAAVAAWRAEGRALGMTDVELEPFADAFEHPERAKARRA